MTKIMVIDDDSVVRDELVIWLKDEGYEALGVDENQAGVEYVFHNRADLVIYDATIPLLNGYEMWLEVHAHLAAEQVPFIFMTDGPEHEDITKGISFGSNPYINKPFKRPDLLQLVQTSLEKTAAQGRKLQNDIEKMQIVLAEEREQRLLKAKMIAMFSHDFRNPL